MRPIVRTTVRPLAAPAALALAVACAAPAPKPPETTEAAVEAAAPEEALHRSADWLALLPEGETKRWFLLDCTGCHQFNETRVFKDGALRTAAQWSADAARMHALFGPDSSFPVVSGHLEPEALGAWLHEALDGAMPRLTEVETASGYELTEFDLPGPDLPHDLALDGSGRVLVTGMFSHRILALDPETGAVEEHPIPVPQANPRALEVDADGRWWALLGAPASLARRDPANGEWRSATVGMYGHSIALDARGAAWTNDHFARGGVRLARVSPDDAMTVETFEGPPFESTAKGPSPIPYELRAAPDGKLWVSLLHGNQLVSFDPATGEFATVDLPDPDAGPRRFDVAADGDLWIPGYGSSVLYRLAPASGRIDRYPLPIPDALPYVARVHPRTGEVWIGTGAADAIVRFDPVSERFTVYPVTTRAATMRHLVIDPERDEIWVAYGASPAIHPTRVARLRP